LRHAGNNVSCRAAFRQRCRRKIFSGRPATSFAFAGQISEGSDRRININFPTALAEAMEFQKGEIIEWIIEDKANIIARRPVVPPSPVTIAEKKGAAPLLSQWEALWKQCARRASTTGSCTRRLREHLLAHLVCPGRHAVSALITALERGVKGGKWRGILRKRRKGRGRARGRDHLRWKNRYFDTRGLFCLEAAQARELTSLQQGAKW
jgi:hypothetical protein